MTKEKIKNWLKGNNLTRDWLAAQCGVDKRTLNNWLSSSRSVPAKAQLIIRKLMEEGAAPMSRQIRLTFSDEEWFTLCEAMKTRKESFLEFVNEALAHAAAEHKRNPEQEQEHGPLPPPEPPAPGPLPGESGNRILADDLEAEESAPALYETEILGNIAAGGLMEGDSVPEPVRIYRPLQKGEYVVRVNGRSMEPTIPDGSLIVLKKYYGPDMPKAGTIVEYNDGRGVTLKRLAKHEGAYTLESVNPGYPDIEPMDGGCISALYIETLPEE